MKITAEFNSNEELLSFISTFGAKSLAPSQGSVAGPAVIEKVKEDKLKKNSISEENVREDATPKVNAEISSVETSTGEIIDTDSTPVDQNETPKVTKEMVRDIVAKIMSKGKQKEAKELIKKYGASKVPELAEEHYAAVYGEAEALL